MKGRQSGMPEEECWNRFFDAQRVIREFFGEECCHGSVVEFGCGYGTFTFPAARHTTGTVYAFDLEAELVDRLRLRAEREAVPNIAAEARDLVVQGTGLPPGTQSHAMIYNLLHIESPEVLLREARRVLRRDGRLSIIHWRRDIPTPRGPSLDIRPSPEECIAWMGASGFREARVIDLEECCPYHYGIVADAGSW